MEPLTRRTLATGLAWSVPVVAVAAAAPAYAASAPCSALPKYTVNWAPAGSTQSSANETITPTGSSVDLTGFTSAFTGSVGPGTNGNLTTRSVNGASWVPLNQAVSNTSSASWATAYQTLTLTFGKSLYCVSFAIFEIDSADLGRGNGRFQDMVQVSGFTASTTSTVLTVSGDTVTAPTPSTTTDLGPTDPQGGALFTATGPVSSITMTYWNRSPRNLQGMGNNQTILIGPITFYTSACICGA